MRILTEPYLDSGHSPFSNLTVVRGKGFEIAGRFVAPAEVYPNSEAWGVDGFTFSDKDAALTKLRALGVGQ